MTPEQRLDRVERMLIQMVKAGRRIRSEWRYKINSLIDAQIKNEMARSAETMVIKGLIKQVTVAQDRNEKAIDKLTVAQDRNEKAIDKLTVAQDRNEKAIDKLTVAQDRNEKAIDKLAVTQDRNEKEITKLTRSVSTLVNKLGKDRNGKT